MSDESSEKNKTEIIDQEKVRHLKSEKKTLELLLDLAPVIIMVLDLKGDIVMINQQGVSVLDAENKEQLIGKNWMTNFLSPDHRKAVTEVFKALSSGVVSKEVEYSHYTNPLISLKKVEKIVEWRNQVVKDDAGRPISVMTTGIDVSNKN